MRKRCFIGLLALSTAVGSAQTLEGAKVTGLSGRVQVKAAKLWRALQLGEQLAENALVQLGEGAHLSLRYRSDGHREEVQGPGELKVGSAEGNRMVVRYGFRSRPLELPRSGGLDAVGGSIANASHSKSGAVSRSLTVPAPIVPLDPAPPPPPPPPPVPASTIHSDIVSPATAPCVPLTQEPELTLAWQDAAAPSLVSTSNAPFSVNAFNGEAVVMDGETEVARLPVKANQAVDFSSLSLREDVLYLVRLEEPDLTRGTFTFRLLNAEERGELLSLILQTNVSKEQHQQRLDRFSALGQYHLAALEGKRWLEEQSSPSPYLLQVVYDLNRDLLRDSRQAGYWKDWAEVRQLPLEL